MADAGKATTLTAQSLEADSFIKDLFNSPSSAVQAVLYFSTGLLIGFLCKRYFKYLAWGLIVAFIVLKWLEYNQAATISWPHVYTLCGFGQTPDVHALCYTLFSWVKVNWLNALAGSIGFLIGFKPSVNHKGVNIKIVK